MALKRINVPTLHAQMGLTPGEPVRSTWVRDWLKSLEGNVRADNGLPWGATASDNDLARIQREVDSIVLKGLDNVEAWYDDEQTELEALRDSVAEAHKLRDELRALRRPDGTLVPDADARLKALGF